MTRKYNAFMLLDRRKNRMVLNQLQAQSSPVLDDYVTEVPDKWEDKSRRMEIRQWRRIKQQLV